VSPQTPPLYAAIHFEHSTVYQAAPASVEGATRHEQQRAEDDDMPAFGRAGIPDEGPCIAIANALFSFAAYLYREIIICSIHASTFLMYLHIGQHKMHMGCLQKCIRQW
jgi:hypothetical protein